MAKQQLNWTPAEPKKDMTGEFQTPPEVCRFMVSLLPEGIRTVLEPTPGRGNIVRALAGYEVTAPTDYFLLDRHAKFDAIVMNPPFSAASGILTNAPKVGWEGMKFGHNFLMECMGRSNHIIALMPWFTISDSDVRLRHIKKFGLRSVTALPRKTFEYARIQTCILELDRGYQGPTEFEVYDLVEKVPSAEEKKQIQLFTL